MVVPSLVVPLALAVLPAGEGFSRDFASPGIPKTPLAMCTFDDGRGPALYVGGVFEMAGSVRAPRVARWDGETWEPLGPGPNLQAVVALAVFDDGSGSGPALFAGGVGPRGLQRWDGRSWRAVPGGSKNGIGGTPGVTALAVVEGASGPELIAAGTFTEMAGAKAKNVIRYDGVSWSPLGQGLDRVYSLATYDDGSGPMLYASTKTTLARWDGSTWSVIGSFDDCVFALTAFDGGAGPELIACGQFTQVGSIRAGGVARWDGKTWAPVGSGVGTTAKFGFPGSIRAAGVYAVGRAAGHELVVGGGFESIDGVPVSSLAAWNGSRWRPLGGEVTGIVRALESVRIPGGAEHRLYAAGDIGHAGGPQGIAAWTGDSWSPLTEGQGCWGSIEDLLVFDDGSGPELYACGNPQNAGGTAVGSVTRWNGSRWSTFGTPLLGPAECLAAFDDGSGPALYAGGSISWIGNTFVHGIARWDGRQWGAVGSGVSGTIHALAVYDDGTGDALFAAGELFVPGTNYYTSSGNIGRWDGRRWEDVGGGLGGWVTSLAVYDEGLGPALFAGGYFASAGGNQSVSTEGLARWDGVAWSAVRSDPGMVIEDMRVLDLGTGDRLYATGLKLLPTGETTAVWSWDGSTFENVGDGASGILYFGDSLGAYERGDASLLVVSGTMPSGTKAEAVASWDGSRWSEVTHANGTISAMENYRGALFFGGSFTRMEDVASSRLAQWWSR